MEFVLELQKLMVSNNYLIAVRDNFENLLGKSVLKITDQKIQGEDIELYVKNRVFSVIVECVQNICGNGSYHIDSKDSVLLMNRLENGYQIVAGTRVNDERKTRLESLLQKLSNSTLDEIKEMKRDVIKTKEGLSEENREKLTFIELYLRSEGKIEHFFESEAGEEEFFMIRIEITNK